MSDEFNNLGDIFRKSLKDLKMESNDQLWDRLDQRLSTQPVVTPKKVFLHSSNISWVSVAAAASLITFVSLAALFFSPKRNEVSISNNKQINNSQPKPAYTNADTTHITNNTEATTNPKEDIAKLTPRNSNIIDNNNSQNIIKQLPKKEGNLNNKNSKPDNSSPQPNYNNTYNQQPQLTNNTANNPLNYTNSPPLVQANNATNNKTIKPTNNQNQQLQAVQNNSNKVIAPKDTSRTINQDNNITTNNNIEVVDKPESDIKPIIIPNIFTPNGDGYNDYFVIKNVENCSNTQLTIHDRNQRVVYEKNNYQNDWDGHGLPDGVYFYTFIYRQIDGKTTNKCGSVTIRR